MATLSLKNIKKIYPHKGNDAKKSKKKKKNDEQPEKKVNLQITEQGVVAVQEFNLEIADKEFIVLVGPSGCGKSTTLRMIAGLEEITEGELYIGDTLVNDVAPKDRDIAMVFQNYALYPHMTVYENMAFALKLRKIPKDEIDRQVKEAAEILDITQYLDRKPKALSGGQRQRVAIGRAIVREPQVFLMDEPLSNLDAKLRNQMRAEIIKLRQQHQHHLYLCYPRPDRGHDPGRPDRHHEGRLHPADRHAPGGLRPSRQPVRGRLHRHAPDELLRRQAGEGGRQVRCRAGRHDRRSVRREAGAAGCQQRGARRRSFWASVPSTSSWRSPGTSAGKVDVSELMGSSVHLHVTSMDRDVVMVVSTMNMTGAEVAALNYGADIQFNFPGHCCHVFNKETGINLEA